MANELNKPLIMNIKHILALAAFAFVVQLSLAQSNLPTTVLGGQSFYYYEIQAGESIYDIASKLGVTKDEIIRNNPSAADGVEAGMKLYFPAPAGTTSAVSASQTHTVEQGETLYGLAKRYGVTVDELIAANPGSDAGIKVGQRLTIPTAAVTAEVNASEQVRRAFAGSEVTMPSGDITPVYHTMLDGESIYSLAKQYNSSIEGLLISNPGLKPEEYQAGTTVKVMPGTALPFNYMREGRRNDHYEVKRGDSYSAVAKAHGISEEELKAANPDMKRLKKGKIIVLPRPINEQVTGEIATIPMEELRAWYEPRLNELYDQLVASQAGNEVSIAMVLPFQLHKSAPPKQAYLYTDFYKGFLLAMDSAKNVTDKHINLKVYDTQHNLNVTDSILNLPELRTMDMIIAPSEPQQLARITAYGQRNRIGVMNCFTTKNEDYRDNPYVYQVNTPTDEMMYSVTRWIDERFKGYNIIYLTASSQEDKEMFEQMRKHITAKRYNTQSIAVNGDLNYNDISNLMDPGSKYLFIPSSGDKTLLKRFIKALKEVKKERFDCDLALVAYPEYVLYLKDHQTDLQDVDTWMFTRFFNAKGFRTRDLEAAYKSNFGGEPLQAIPHMAIFGYDMGMYLLKSLCVDGCIDEETPMYKGIQNSFEWQRTNNWSGYTNQAIEFVHFSTDHQITVTVR